MNTHNTNQLLAWRAWLNDLRWTPNHVEHSTRVALSRAAWLCIDREAAIQAILKVASGLFDATPHILFQTWQTISEQIFNPAECELLAA